MVRWSESEGQPTIAGDVSVVTKDPVAGNGHGNCVCTAGLRDGPC